MPKLMHRDKLLSDIAEGLWPLIKNRTPLHCIEVVFFDEDGQGVAFDLRGAIDAIANDKFWDERGDWSQANKAVVRTI